MRRLAVGILAAAVGAITFAASPAQAEPGDPVGCLQGPSGGPTQNVVTVNGFDVTISPGALPGDALSAAGFVLGAVFETVQYAFCVEGGTLDPVRCRIWSLGDVTNYGEYVEQDPETGAITIRGNELMAKLTSPCPPL